MWRRLSRVYKFSWLVCCYCFFCIFLCVVWCAFLTHFTRHSHLDSSNSYFHNSLLRLRVWWQEIICSGFFVVPASCLNLHWIPSGSIGFYSDSVKRLNKRFMCLVWLFSVEMFIPNWITFKICTVQACNLQLRSRCIVQCALTHKIGEWIDTPYSYGFNTELDNLNNICVVLNVDPYALFVMCIAVRLACLYAAMTTITRSDRPNRRNTWGFQLKLTKHHCKHLRFAHIVLLLVLKLNSDKLARPHDRFDWSFCDKTYAWVYFCVFIDVCQQRSIVKSNWCIGSIQKLTWFKLCLKSGLNKCTYYRAD